MSTLVSAQGASFSGSLAGTSAFTYTSSTTLLSATPVAGDYVFVAVWLTRSTATTAVQNANGTYGSVKCGTVYLTCMENTSVPTSLSGTTTTNFHAYNAATTIANNTPNIAIFGAPYTSGMSRQIVVTGFNSSASTAILLVTAMAVQGIYTPASNPRTTWCNTISAGGVIDATSGSGLGWTSSGTPSISSFGSTKVNNSNLTSAIVDDVSAGSFTGVLNLGSTGYQTTQLFTRYANQQGLYTGTIDGYGFGVASGSNFFVTTNSNNPIPPNLSGGPSTYTGNAKLAVGQSISGVNITRDTYITSFSYISDFFGTGPRWIINTSQTQVGSIGTTINVGTEQPVLAVMFTNNSTVGGTYTAVGNVTGTPNNGLTYIDPQGATTYVTTFGQSSGVIITSTNTALPTSGKMTIPFYGGNATMSWTSKPSSTSLAGCTIPATPSDPLLYQIWIDNAGFTPTCYWDTTPVLSNGSTQSTAPSIETPTSVTATGTTGFQIGSLIMTYGANRSGINPVNLYGLLRLNGGTNYGFGAAFAFQPNKAAIIGTVSEQVEPDTSESSGAARTLAKNSELTDAYTLSGPSALTLPRTSEKPLALTSEIQNLLAHAVVSETNETPKTENFSATSKSLTGAVSEINTGKTGGRSLGGAKTNQANETPSTENQRVMLFGEKGTETTVATTTGNSRATNSSKTSEAAKGFTTNGTTSRALFLVGSVVAGISTTSKKALAVARTVASNLLSTTTITSSSLIVRVSQVSEIIYSTSQSIYNHRVAVDYTLGAMVARGGYIPTLNSILGYGLVGQEALGYGITNAINNWYSTTAIPRLVINYIETGAVNLLSTTENAKSVIRNVVSRIADLPTSTSQRVVTIPRISTIAKIPSGENGKSFIRNLVSTVSETPKSENQKTTAIARTSAVAETPKTTSQRSVARSTASAVAKALSSQNAKSIGKSVVGAVNGVASGENAKQIARNLVSFVAIIASGENQTSKTLSRAASVFTVLTSVGTRLTSSGKVSEVAERATAENAKSSAYAKDSMVAEKPTTTSQRSIAHSFATAANIVIQQTSMRAYSAARGSEVAQRFFTNAFAIILKLTTGFISTFTEYSKTEGFTEYSKTETTQDDTKAVFTTPSALTSFRDDGVASYTEGQ